jgi:predicted ribosomally synthesized peptide with nif11-like leader
MAQEDAKKFIEKFYSDKTLREKMKAAQNDEEKKKIAKDLGLSFTKEEFEKAYRASKELSDEELDAVAGGSSAAWVGTAVTSTAAVVAAFATCGW